MLPEWKRAPDTVGCPACSCCARASQAGFEICSLGDEDGSDPCAGVPAAAAAGHCRVSAHGSVALDGITQGAGVLVLDAEGRIVQASDDAVALLGRARRTLIGEAADAILEGLDWRRLLPSPLVSAELPARADPCADLAGPLRWADTPVHCGASGLVRFDIEISRLPAPASLLLVLRPAEPATEGGRSPIWHTMMQRLQAIVDLSPSAAWIAEDDHIIFANRAAAHLMDSTRPEAVVGRSVKSLLRADAHEELERQTAAALRHPGVVGNLSGMLLRQGAPERLVEIALTALPDHGHTTVQMVMHDVTRRQSEMRELERSRQALRRLSANIVEGREAERQRIARELHDELGQSLLALKLDLADCEQTGVPASVRPCLLGALDRLDAIMASVRRIAADLRPLMLDELGPGPAIEWLVNDFARRTGLHCRLQLDDIGTLEDQQTAITLYRMVQESLTNILRHAKASEVNVALSRRDGEILLRVSDNGVGLPVDAALRDSQFGLLGMRERADMLGGELTLDSVVGHGTRVLMRVPLRPTPGPAADPARA
jgi:PAS domain S-box-containing protein